MFFTAINNDSHELSKSPKELVFICVTGKVYHSTQYCRGLRSATHKIITVDKDTAINKYNRRACKVCY